MSNIANAHCCAKWILDNHLENLNTSIGKKKLQKLLYFAQLISLTKNGVPLFDDTIFAFEFGCVVEDVRLNFNSGNLDDFDLNSLSPDQIKVLELTEELFGDLSPEELIEINHSHSTWNRCYKSWQENGSQYRHHSCEVDIAELQQNEVLLMKKVLDAYEKNQKSGMECITINGVAFYYDSKQLTVTQDIVDQLVEFAAEENAYSFYKDDNMGLVIM